VWGKIKKTNRGTAENRSIETDFKTKVKAQDALVGEDEGLTRPRHANSALGGEHCLVRDEKPSQTEEV